MDPNHSRPYFYRGIECGPGWYPLYGPIVAKCQRQGISIAQVKEKFGLLRIYVEKPTPAITKAIYEAEAASARTCETCGAPGHMYDDGYRRVRCKPCREGE